MGRSHISHFTSRFSLHWWSLLGMIRYDGFKAFCIGWNRSCLLTSRQHRQSSDLTYRKNLFFWCHEGYWVYWCRYFRLTCLMFSWIATLSSTPFATVGTTDLQHRRSEAAARPPWANIHPYSLLHPLHPLHPQQDSHTLAMSDLWQNLPKKSLAVMQVDIKTIGRCNIDGLASVNNQNQRR